ncbi:MAG: retropepsin-like aspartic protease [Chthoniobacterales bacterium]
MPFRLAGGAQPLMLLPVSVNGHGPFQFILDTGAGTTLLTRSLATQLNITPTGAKRGQTAGGAVDVKLSTLEIIAVGELIREHVDVAIVDLSHLERAVGAKIDGDLGHNVFGASRLTIDYRQSVLRIDDPKGSEDLGRQPLAEVPARLAHPGKPLILVDAHVNGCGPFCFAIDTGTSTSVIGDELARELQLQTSAGGNVTTGSASISMTAARLETVRVGGCQVGELMVMVGGFLPMLSNVIGTKLDGIIGYDFLRSFKVVIDYPNGSFSLFSA